MASEKPIFVVSGVGNASGTGGNAARAFSKAGYRVALIARRVDTLHKTAEEITNDGGEAVAFPIPSYSFGAIKIVFEEIKAKWPNAPIRVALFNTAHRIVKPFLDISEEELVDTLRTNAEASFSFARQAITSFQGNELDDKGGRGTLIFTGATASVRGNTGTTAFSSGKHAVRALSQSLAKEFGKENIHVVHAVIDGPILTDAIKRAGLYKGPDNPDTGMNPKSIAAAYLYLASQDRSAWTWELDLRPAHEKW